MWAKLVRFFSRTKYYFYSAELSVEGEMFYPSGIVAIKGGNPSHAYSYILESLTENLSIVKEDVVIIQFNRV